MKLYRNAIILVVIVALLVGVYFAVDRFKAADNPAGDEPEEIIKLTDYTSDEVISLTLENPDGTFVIVKKDDSWILSSPANIKYDSTILSSTVINACSVTADKLVEENAQDLSVYELDKAVTVRLKTKDGNETVLKVGGMTPTGSGYYASLEGSGDVYVISSYTGVYLIKDRNGLRSKSLFDFASDEITTLAMERKGSNVFASVKEEGSNFNWTMTEPIKGSVNASALSPMLETLAKTNIVEFIEDKPTDLAQYGLKDPAYAFDFTTRESGSYRLMLGDERTKDFEIYAMLDGGDEVFTIDSSDFTFLDKPLKEIVDVFAYIVSISEVQKISLTMDGRTTNMVLDVYEDADGNSDADKDKFYVDGVDASGRDENDDQPFRKFYQALIGISVDSVEISGKPVNDAEITIEYTLKDGSMKVEYVPKDENFYYVVKNGQYAGVTVKKSKKDFGVAGMREAYKTMMDFLANNN